MVLWSAPFPKLIARCQRGPIDAVGFGSTTDASGWSCTHHVSHNNRDRLGAGDLGYPDGVFMGRARGSPGGGVLCGPTGWHNAPLSGNRGGCATASASWSTTGARALRFPVEEVGDTGCFELDSHGSRGLDERDVRASSLRGSCERDEHADHRVIERFSDIDRRAIQLHVLIGYFHRGSGSVDEVATGFEAESTDED
jgi:hypothetical protein